MIRSLAAIAMSAASLSLAAILPGSDGKLDFGIEDLPVPPVLVTNTTPPRTAQLLADAYGSRQPSFIRVQCVRELGDTRLAVALPAVKKALSDPDADVRAVAAEALVPLAADEDRSAGSRKAFLADPQAMVSLKGLLNDKAGTVRAAALRAIVAIEGAATPVVAEALASDDPDRLSAAVSLAATPQQGQTIGARLDKMPSRFAAIRALGRVKAASQRPLLEKLAAGPDVGDAAAACESLGLLGAPESAPLLQQLCSHRHATVRRNAITAMGTCAAVDVRRRQGIAMLADVEPSVQQAAVDVLGANLTPEIVSQVGAKLGHEYKPLYMAARRALSTQTDVATRDACINYAGDLLDNAEGRRREDGSYVLGRYRSLHRLDRHIEIATNPPAKADWGSVAQAVESLGMIADPKAVPAVTAIVKRYDELTRSTDAAPSRITVRAFISAGRLGIREILPIAARVLKLDPMTSDTEERAAAAFCIGAAGAADLPGANDLSRVLGNGMDGNKPEVLKAMGNLRLKSALNSMKDFPMSEGALHQWLKQWATARITGQPEQHPRTPENWSARTFYRDITAGP